MDLWDSVPTDASGPASESTTTLATMTPDQMVTHDVDLEVQLKHHAFDLHQMIQFSDQLVKSVYEVADYIPDLSTTADRTFWQENLLPQLKKSLVEDVRARNSTVRVISSIRDMAITIQKCGEIVKQTKGSPTAVAIARKNIKASLDSLEHGIQLVSTLENHAVALFAEQTDKIFNMIGPKAANFIDQKSDVEAAIAVLEKQKRQYCDELHHLKAEIEGLSNLIHVTDARVNGKESALKATKERAEQMAALNRDIDNKIQSIPETVNVTTRHSSRGFWFKRHSWTTVQSVKNPDKDAQRNYFESLIASREARIKATKNEMDDIEDAKVKLQQELIDLQTKLAKCKQDLEALSKDFPAKIAIIDQQIEEQRKKLVALDEEQNKIEGMTNLKGNALVECLVAVRSYNKSAKGAAEMYAPLCAILNGIKAMVEADVELLLLDDINVFLAGNRLLNHVGFLSSYSGIARQLTTTSMEHNQIAASLEFKMLDHTDKNHTQ